MADRDPVDVHVQRVVAKRSGRLAWLAAGGVGLALIGVIVAGRIGTEMTRLPVPTAAPSTGPSAAPAPSAIVAVASPAPTALPSVAPVPVGPDVFASLLLGYGVRRAALPGEVATPQSDFQTVDFVHSRISLASPGFGRIQVAVGTPARGALVPVVAGSAFVFGGSLAALEGAIRGLDGVTVTGAAATTIDGEQAGLLDATLAVDGRERAVALAFHGGRAYVITADGFDTGTPQGTHDARGRALADFLGRFEFRGPPLYASTRLGFEVPLLAAGAPVVIYGSDTTGGSGAATFGNGTFNAWIRVDVGTQAHPALPPILVQGGARGAGLWAADTDTLLARFTASYGPGMAKYNSRIAGEPSWHIERPGDIGAAVIVAHAGRVYVITAATTFDPGVLEAFDNFVRGFRFLGPGS